MDSSQLTRKRAAVANVYVARQNPVDADMVTRNNRLKAAAQAFVAPYSQSKYKNMPCCPPLRTRGAASDYGDSRLDEASFIGAAINTFTNVMDRRAGAAICCGPAPATTLPQGVQLYGDCACLTVPSRPIITLIIPGDTTLTVYFTGSANTGGSPIRGYEYSIDGGVTFLNTVTSSPFIITGLTNDTTYSVVLRAINISGASANSASIPATPGVMIMNITTASADSLMSLPFDGVVSLSVDWGDGSKQTYTSTPIEKTYATAGSYAIRITGIATSFGNTFGYTGAVLITSVSKWGVSGLTSLAGAFFGANTLVSVASIPTGITDLSFMFFTASAFNQDLSSWDVSQVTNMSYMFYSASVFNSPLNWGSKTSNVTNMTNMFANAGAFNRDLSGWDVSKVTDMSFMFYGATTFNILPNWGTKTANVQNMAYMFTAAYAFNQDLSSWDVSKVINMSGMFVFATSFNILPNWGSKTARVQNMNNMFTGASAFNQDLSSWDVSQVTDMGNMFSYTTSFNILPNWGSKTARVQNMNGMFSNATAFNQNLSGWDVSQVTDMGNMFGYATSFNILPNWGSKTAKVQSMYAMFAGATAFNKNLSTWDVSQVTDMSLMFFGATSFNSPLTWGTKTGNVFYMSYMFNNASAFNQNLSGWQPNKLIDVTNMFCGCPNMAYPTYSSKYPSKIITLISQGQNVNC